MFKRPRLRPTNGLVNESPWLALLFLAAACGGPGEQVETGPVPEPDIAPETAVDTSNSLPAVWSTDSLGTPIVSVAVAGALGSTVAASFEDGGLQFFNFEGDRITQKADLGAAELSDGRYLMLSGTPVTVFPGIGTDGALKIFIHGGQMPEPLTYDLDAGAQAPIVGLCSAAPATETDGVLRLGFWTEAAPEVLTSGRIVQIEEELIFLPDEPVSADRPITACLLEDAGAQVFSAPARAAIALHRRGRVTKVLLDTSGNYSKLSDEGSAETFTVRDGITVRTPQLAVDMAGTGDTRGGGYPGGLIVVGGEDVNGEHRIVYIDPSDFTLMALE